MTRIGNGQAGYSSTKERFLRRDKLLTPVLALCTFTILFLCAHVIVALDKPQHLVRRDLPVSTFGLVPLIEVTAPTTTTTSTTEELTTTTVPPTTTTQRASRGAVRATSSEDHDDGFWRRLANCESADGTSGQYIGYFQFSYDTARKVGIDGSESYEVQKSAAISWAEAIHPNEGTNSGWPNCWWRALAG